jgi:ATP-dependent Lon protease
MPKLTIPIVPINQVVFPGSYLRLVATNISQRKLHAVTRGTRLKLLGLLAYRDPKLKQTYEIGTMVSVIREEAYVRVSETVLSNFFNGQVKTFSKDDAQLVVVGVDRFRVLHLSDEGDVLFASIEIIKDQPYSPPLTLIEELRVSGLQYVKEAGLTPVSLAERISNFTEERDLALLGFKIAAVLDLVVEEKQSLLEDVDLERRTSRILSFLRNSMNSDLVQKDPSIHNTKTDLGKSRMLQPPPRASKGYVDDITKLQKKFEDLELEPETKEYIGRELSRLRSLQSNNPEHSIVRKYVETVLSLPWNTTTQDNYDLSKAQQVLDRDHYGLERIKSRILEHLAVKSLKGNMKGSILCFHGPPGVGKTSLGKSIAEALGRKFYRISLGGVRDEAEIRGHRRTYIGALPGNLINALISVGTKNPVVLLDEIDKVGRDMVRGDPSSALLEVLDPAQNHTFSDHYVALPFDLSNIMFIATANSLETISAPLLDRMEVINLSGYSTQEKLKIARTYLLPRQIQESGITADIVSLSDSVLEHIILHYTREPGVRQLERAIGSVCRSIAVHFIKAKAASQTYTTKPVVLEDIEEILGISVYDDDLGDRVDVPGVAMGLAWTSFGGKVLLVETSKAPGNGQLRITGHLGEVMKESVVTALSWIKSNLRVLMPEGKSEGFDGLDLHVHFPAAAIPKDGPSAGVTITTALVSLLSNIKVRSDTAMTGEVSLKGVVLPVGGIKDKVLAAHRQGVKRVILPFGNLKSLKELPENLKTEMEFLPVHSVSEVLVQALEHPEELLQYLVPSKL